MVEILVFEAKMELDLLPDAAAALPVSLLRP
jgi:hypothetical protein